MAGEDQRASHGFHSQHVCGRCAVIRCFLAVAVACAAILPARAQSPVSGKFNITQTNPVISTSTVSGKEQYRLSTTAEGHTFSSTVWVANGETPIFSEVEETLSPDWSLKRYVFNGLVGGIKQKFEAWADGGKVEIQVTSERMNPRRSVELAPNTLVLDNFVPTHFQILLNRFAAAAASSPEVQALDVSLIVPQRLLALKGRFSCSGTDTGVLNDKQIEVRKYVLEAPNVKAEIWANDQNQLLGVYFPQPDIEYLEEHFELPQLKLAMKKTLPSERPVSFLSRGRQLLGSLMLPPESLGKKDRYPLVVMVPGFGPLDRDGTVGRSKPLRDIAVGLANRRFATLRYDKPTRTFYGKIDLAHLTVEEETIDAAVDAIALAVTLPEVDRENVFLLGHSQGAGMAPFILKRTSHVHGAILMAAPGRPLEEFLQDQLLAAAKMRGMAEETVEPRVQRLKEQLSAIRTGSGEHPAMVLDMPAGFWRSLMAYDSIAGLREMKVPVLVLQGDRDMRANGKDFELVTSAVPPGSLESEYFTGLNHIFAPASEGTSGSEIMTGTHVAGQVIDRIVSWLHKHNGHLEAELASEANAR